jgi:hypothetical protein
MAEKSSITRIGTHEPWELQVSRGQIAYHKTLFKFGSNPVVDASLETVWSQGGIYVYPAAASVMKVSSSSANDDATGTGARTVLVAGLDANYNEISETVALDGQTEVLTTSSFIRVFRAFVVTAGSGATAAGDIYVGTGTVTSGVPATVYAKIPLGANQTLMAVWTVPAGYTAYMDNGTFSAAASNTNHSIKGQLCFRPFGGVMRVGAEVTLANGFVSFDFEYPISFPEKTDVESRAIALSGNGFYVSSTFDLIYIQNA